MDTRAEDVNLGNPNNLRRDAREDNEPKVTNADHPRRAGRGADDLFDDSAVRPDERASRADELSALLRDTPPAASPPAQQPIVERFREVKVFDMHSPTVHDPLIEMTGELTSHRDPLSGESGTHPVAVGVGAVAGGMAVGAATGLMAGSVGGPLGAALGTAAGAVIGAFAGGYAGKGIGEAVNPTTEDHYWRSAFRTRHYVTKGSRYEEYEPAYGYGIQMRQRHIHDSWEDAEPAVRTGWEESEYALIMDWNRAMPAIRDAWDHLTPEPVEPPVSDEEKMENE